MLGKNLFFVYTFWKVQTRAATYNYLHYWLIGQLFSQMTECQMSKLMLKMLITISQSKMTFPKSLIFKTEVQNPKAFYLLKEMTKKINKSSHSGSCNQQKFDTFAWKMTQTINPSFKNCWGLILFQPTNQLLY